MFHAVINKLPLRVILRTATPVIIIMLVLMMMIKNIGQVLIGKKKIIIILKPVIDI